MIWLPIITFLAVGYWIISPASGKTMYKQYFGEPGLPCVTVFNRQEQGFDDCSARMHFKTCPPELKRMFKNIEEQELQRIDFYGQYADCSEQEPNWWIPSDKMLKIRYRHWQRMWTIDFYINADSTEAFCQSFSY